MREDPTRLSLRRVLWGLPVVVAIWALAVMIAQGRIEADLKQRADNAFGQADLDWADVIVHGRQADLIGIAYSEQERGLARRLLRKTWGIGTVEDRSSLATLQQKYVWTAAVDDDGVRLMGFYPNGRARANVLTAARQIFPERAVADEMQPARGAPADNVWLGAIEFSLAQLSRLEQGGRVNLIGTELAVAGVATSVNAYRTIKGALYRNVPAGVVLVTDKVEPPRVTPYTWAAEFKNGQLLLSGYVPSEADRDVLIQSAKEAFEQSPIVDKMAVAGGAPKEWLAASVIVVQQLARLIAGRAELSDTSLSLSAQAQKQETAESVRADLRLGLAVIYKIDADIKFREATIPTVSPFVTTISFDGQRLMLGGHSPGRSSAEQIAALARQQRKDVVVINQLTLAKGAPEGWLSCVLAGAGAVLQLENGKAELVDRRLYVEGLTKDEAIGESLPKQVRAAANRACSDTVDLKVVVPPEPNLDFRVVHDQKTVRLDGEVPNSATEKWLAELTRQLFPNAKLETDLRITPAQSKKWPKVAALALEQLAKLRRGAASITRQHLSLDGEATDTAVATAVRQQLKAGIATSYTVSTSIEVKSAAMLWAEREAKRKAEEVAAAAAERRREIERKKREAEAAAKRKAEEEAAARRLQEEEARRKAEAARRRAEQRARAAQEAQAQRAAQEAARRAREEDQRRKAEAAARLARQQQRERCQQAFDAALRDGTIVFEHGSATIEARSFPTLNRIAKLHGVCGTSQIEIAGHTDSSGTAERNQALSEQRAASVRQYLVDNGVPAAQLAARGYGETRPLVPNTTPGNRAKNRRIEFKVRVN